VGAGILANVSGLMAQGMSVSGRSERKLGFNGGVADIRKLLEVE